MTRSKSLWFLSPPLFIFIVDRFDTLFRPSRQSFNADDDRRTGTLAMMAYTPPIAGRLATGRRRDCRFSSALRGWCIGLIRATISYFDYLFCPFTLPRQLSSIVALIAFAGFFMLELPLDNNTTDNTYSFSLISRIVSTPLVSCGSPRGILCQISWLLSFAVQRLDLFLDAYRWYFWFRCCASRVWSWRCTPFLFRIMRHCNASRIILWHTHSSRIGILVNDFAFLISPHISAINGRRYMPSYNAQYSPR